MPVRPTKKIHAAATKQLNVRLVNPAKVADPPTKNAAEEIFYFRLKDPAKVADDFDGDGYVIRDRVVYWLPL